MSADCRTTTLGRHIDRHIGRLSADISVDMSVNMSTHTIARVCLRELFILTEISKIPDGNSMNLGFQAQFLSKCPDSVIMHLTCSAVNIWLWSLASSIVQLALVLPLTD